MVTVSSLVELSGPERCGSGARRQARRGGVLRTCHISVLLIAYRVAREVRSPGLGPGLRQIRRIAVGARCPRPARQAMSPGHNARGRRERERVRVHEACLLRDHADSRGRYVRRVEPLVLSDNMDSGKHISWFFTEGFCDL